MPRPINPCVKRRERARSKRPLKAGGDALGDDLEMLMTFDYSGRVEMSDLIPALRMRAIGRVGWPVFPINLREYTGSTLSDRRFLVAHVVCSEHPQ